MGPVAVTTPKLRISQAIRFVYKPFPVGGKLRPPVETLFRSEKHGRALAMYVVLQIQPKDAVFESHLLIHELITFWRNGRRPSDHAHTCNRPWCSSGSGHAPESAETSTGGREHNLATVRSPSGRSHYPGIVEGQPLGRATCGWRHVKVRHHARNDSADESHCRTVWREGRGRIVPLT